MTAHVQPQTVRVTLINQEPRARQMVTVCTVEQVNPTSPTGKSPPSCGDADDAVVALDVYS